MRNVILLGLASFFTDVASEMVYPLIPFFLTAGLGAGTTLLGVVEGVAECIASLLKAFSGYLADRSGRRKPLTIAGYALSLAGKVALALAHTWGMVFGARVLDRIGKGIRTAPRDALIADSTPSGRWGRAFGVHRGMDTAGAIVGVAIAWWMLTGDHGGYRPVFLWAVVPAALGIVALCALREGAQPRTVHRARPDLRWSRLPRPLKRYLLVAFVFALGNSSNTFLLLRAGGESATDALVLYGAYNLAYAFFSWPAGRLSDLFGRKGLLVAGYLTYAMVYAGFALLGDAPPSWAVWSLFLCYGLYSGLTDGVEKALVTDLAPPGVRASALGLHATLVGLGLLPASLIAGILWTAYGPAATFAVGAATGLGAAIALIVLRLTRESDGPLSTT
jgi:MFS family permease